MSEGGKLRRQQGFTLLEVVVAITIITTLVGTFAPLILSSIERIHWAGKRTQTLYDIRSEMEREMALVSGTPTDVLIKKTHADGSVSTWPVNGKLIFVQAIDEEERIDEFLVSFVVSKE